jgi:hypothetical protein
MYSGKIAVPPGGGGIRKEQTRCTIKKKILVGYNKYSNNSPFLYKK